MMGRLLKKPNCSYPKGFYAFHVEPEEACLQQQAVALSEQISSRHNLRTQRYGPGQCRGVADNSQLISDASSSIISVAERKDADRRTTSVLPSQRMGNRFRRLSTQSSVDKDEIRKFAALADQWWDSKGPFAELMRMNPARLSFIRSAICRYYGKDQNSPKPLAGMTAVDVGCGGGFLSESLARLGATVTAIDATQENPVVAAAHAARDPVTAMIEFRCATAERLVEEGKTFDIVASLEVIEHVADPMAFSASLGALCKPGGAIFVSTMNRTLASYLLAIVAAERVLRWVPMGTHDWQRFISPEELTLMLNRADAEVQEIAGMQLSLPWRKWELCQQTGVNYIAFATKLGETGARTPGGKPADMKS
ncbi:hypothetical protein CBR_g50290 [Chara braunii]|uniref:Ubiquinone biosynthesis O-methyltransferase, mitochondrial n=1 Tax=Chara braunii TaxID=69332 RepID=A0A388K5B8_CHABU|nr:hypothetical protein CBR_g50290 [Chara braunii]|eukprot:GBG65248.1 hypothetical protein CBR_g50290 [Chara braunii]